MLHETPLINTLVFGLGIAFIFGVIANRIRIPPLVGYLFAGIMLGPFTPGYVADQNLAPELAEIGVILLMFGVGLHFSLKDLLSVKAIAVPGALVQISFATLLGVGLSALMGWGLVAGMVFGLALSVASTVVLLKALQERRLIETEKGKIAVGWLIVEDLAMVLALVLLPAVAGIMGTTPESAVPSQSLTSVVGITLLKVAAFVVFMLVVGRRIIPWVLHYVAHTGSRELFRLSVLAIALGVAFAAAKLFGVSLALGAFFAGMILSESQLSHRAAEESLPLRDAFAVLFFVSVGMLFDPHTLIDNPLPVLATLFIILIGKSVAAYLIVIAFRYPVPTALTISASLAQIGEFSFILAELGVKLELLPEQGRDFILAGAILSILLNPVAFWAVGRLRPYLEKVPLAAGTPATVGASAGAAPSLPVVNLSGSDAKAEQPLPVATNAASGASGAIDSTLANEDDYQLTPSTLEGHTIVIGYGRVGSIVGEKLYANGIPFIAVDETRKVPNEMLSDSVEFIMGNAAKADVLQATNIERARHLVIAVPNAFEAGQIVQQARALNPELDIIARVHSDAEISHLQSFGANTVIMGEREIARTMIEYLQAANAVSSVVHDILAPAPSQADDEDTLPQKGLLVAEEAVASTDDKPHDKTTP